MQRGSPRGGPLSGLTDREKIFTVLIVATVVLIAVILIIYLILGGSFASFIRDLYYSNSVLFL